MMKASLRTGEAAEELPISQTIKRFLRSSAVAMVPASQYKASALLLVISVFVLVFTPSTVESSADLSTVCLRNCAQCKKMFGPYFEGQLCAEACVKFNGQLVPECTDVASIAPFLNKLD